MKIYLKGFLKGLGILFILPLYDLTLTHFMGENSLHTYLVILANIVGVIVAFYLIYKNKLHKSWLFLAVLTGFFSYPFLFGYIELNKTKSS